MKKNLKTYRDLSDYVEVLDDLFLVYVESDQCDNDGQEYRSKVAGCYNELKTELVKAQKN
jgi:hypothetical protein